MKLACRDLRWEVTIGTLCRLAGDAELSVRAVARVRLASVALEPQVDAIPDHKKLFVPCYAQRLKASTTAAEARYWAPLLVALAAELGELKPHLPLVAARREDDLRALAYEQIWYRGGSGEVAHVKRLLASEKPIVRRAILRGMRRIAKKERKVACPLLRGLINDKDVEVAGSAAMHLVVNCAKARREVVTAAQKHLQRRATSVALVGSAIVAARDYRDIRSNVHPDLRKLPPKALVARVTQWLVRVVGLKWVKGAVRVQALSGLTFLDPAQAKQLARRHRKDPDPEMRKKAREIAP